MFTLSDNMSTRKIVFVIVGIVADHTSEVQENLSTQLNKSLRYIATSNLVAYLQQVDWFQT